MRLGRMVKMDDIPEEKGRIPLDQLSDFLKYNGHGIDLIATSEKVEPEQPNKTGGVVINFWTGVNYQSKYDINKKVASSILYEEGLQVTQKYSKIAGKQLKKNLEEMGIADTNELKDAFYRYELFSQRTGFPRLIPITKSEKKPEQLPKDS
jgi:hypothetical protein